MKFKIHEQQKSVMDRIRSGEIELPDIDKVTPETKSSVKPINNKKKETKPDVQLASNLNSIANKVKKHILSLSQFSLDKWSKIGEVAHRKIAGTDAWSQHAFGNALDWHSTPAIMQQLTDYLVANAKKLNVRNVIYNRRIWNSSKGWHSYKKHPHTDHVHVDFEKSDTKTSKSDAWKFHENVEKFGNELLKFITTDAETYFKKFRWTWTSWGDDEQKARAYFDAQIKQAKEFYGINDQSFKNALPQTQHNIKQLNAVIKYVAGLISNGDQGSKTITYKYFDKTDKKWKDQKVKFTWDYM